MNPPPQQPDPGITGILSIPDFAGRTRDAQQEYKAILANAPLGIAFTRDRRFTLCNPRFAEMFGWAPADLIGQEGGVVYPTRESYEALGAIAVPLLSAGRQLDVEWEMRRRDGSSFLCRVIARAIEPARPSQGTIWIAEDITVRKRQADEAARLLHEHQAILDAASIGICFVRDRVIVRCNRRMEEMYGVGPGEMNGQSTALTYARDEDFAATERAYREMASGKVFTQVLQARRRDGSPFWERSTGRAVDPADPARGSVWLLEDISEQKRAEEELQRVLAEQQAITGNVVIGIAFVRDRRIVRCNRRFEELFGYAAGEAAGLSTRALHFTDEEFERGATDLAVMNASGTATYEQFQRRKDGSGFWCRRTGRAVEPGNTARGYVWLFEDVTERKRADEEIGRMVREQELILDNASVGIAFVRNRVIQRCNRFLEDLLGAAPGSLAGQASRALFAAEEDWAEAGRLAYAGTAPGQTHDSEWRFRRADGSTFLCRTRGRRIDDGGEEQEWIWSFEDVTPEREAEARTQRALIEQELIFANATVGIAFARHRVMQRCNPQFEAMFGYRESELVGRTSAVLFASEAEHEEAGGRMYAALAGGQAYVTERQLRRKDGSAFWCRVVAKAIDPVHPEEGAIAIYEDITADRAAREMEEAARHALQASRDALEKAVAERTAELLETNRRLEAEIADRRQAETRAQHLADHDALTGLPNRRLLEDRLTQALAQSRRNRKQTAVMFVDLDRFKHINDSLGHAAGDVVLKECAERLIRQLRVGDTICRMGGDEFVVVLPEIKRASDAAHVAGKILETVGLPFRVEGQDLHITPSVGISVYPDDGKDAESLIRNADAAMYHAKETGRANYQFFTEQMNQAASRRLSLEAELRRAVQAGELRLLYQPITGWRDAEGQTLAAGRVVAHEALLRWQHPQRGLLAPGEFQQLAEDTGLILRMGEWVFAEACRWGARSGADEATAVHVNLSARQFNDPKLGELLARVLKETGLPARRLVLEIPEPAVMQNTDAATAVLGRLGALGVRLALDGFGAAYSSLVALRNMPVDQLKIDRSLVSEVHKEGRGIVSGITSLAHALGLQVTAVGVESEAQREALVAAGCDCLQGNLLGSPAPG